MWLNVKIGPVQTFTQMVNLTRIPSLPVAHLPTTVRGLSMAHMPHRAQMDVSRDIHLGGTYTPRNPRDAIIPANMVPPQAVHLYQNTPVMWPPIGRLRPHCNPEQYKRVT